MSATPRPWRRSPKAGDAIIADVPCSSGEREHYGGKVVAESVGDEDLALILLAITDYDRARSRR